MNRLVLRRALALGLCALLMLVEGGKHVAQLDIGGGGGGEDDGMDVALTARQFDVGQLTSTVHAGTLTFLVDQATRVSFHITSSLPSLQTSITGPGNQTVDSTTISGLGGEYYWVQGDSSLALIPDLPTFMPGFHYIYALPSLGSGKYVVHFQAPSVTGKELVFVELALEGAVNCSLYPQALVTVNTKPLTLTLAAFQDSLPIRGAEIIGYLQKPGGAMQTINFLDNGASSSGDLSQGDGLYSTVLQPSPSQIYETGRYFATARIIKHSGADTVFVRDAGTEFSIVEQAARFTGSVPSDHGDDENGDGCFERLVLNVAVQTFTPGRFQLEVDLQTRACVKFMALGRDSLLAGVQSMAAEVDASELRDLGDFGPFTITGMRLFYLGPSGAAPADEETDLNLTTGAYSRSAFGCVPMALTDTLAATPMDVDHDGDFDSLAVDVGIVAPHPGTYKYSAALFDSCAGLVTYIDQAKHLNGTGGTEMLRLVFPGKAIGKKGVGGPFDVGNLVVLAPDSTSVLTTTAGVTPHFSAASFDSFLAPPDCNGNGRPDACDIFSGASADTNGNGVPDECDALGALRIKDESLPKEFALLAVSPNPTPGGATIRYEVPVQTEVYLRVVDVAGREVAVLAHGPHSPGRYEIDWNRSRNGQRVSPGIYFIQLQAGSKRMVQRLLVLH